jgi:hypothetical protein
MGKSTQILLVVAVVLVVMIIVAKCNKEPYTNTNKRGRRSKVSSTSGNAPVTVGDHAYGGIVATVYNDENGDQHGFVVAEEDEPYPHGDALNGFTQWKKANNSCQNKVSSQGGVEYNDWSLPNFAQVNKILKNRYTFDPNDPNNAGGFLINNLPLNSNYGKYWTIEPITICCQNKGDSSCEYDNCDTNDPLFRFWAMDATWSSINAEQQALYKTLPNQYATGFNARCVRSF